MAALVQHNRFVEAVELGLRLGQGGVGVETRNLGASGNPRVLHPPPGGGAAAGPLLDVQVGPEGRDEDQEVVLQVVQAYAQHLGALVGQGADVDVFAVAGHLHQLGCDGEELLVGVGKLDPHYAAAATQPV